MTSFVREPDPVPTDLSSRPLTVKLITGKTVPAELVARACALQAAGPFGRGIWWESWWRHLRPRASELFLLTVWQGDELVGLAPWYAQRSLAYGRVVRFLGDGRACSDYATILTAPRCRSEVWNEVTRWVAAEAGRSWDAFVLAGVSAADQNLQTFFQRVSQQNVLVHERSIANTWRLALPDSWDGYLRQLSKQHRNRVRRAKRDMFDSGRAILRRVTSPEDLSRGFAIQHQLHQMRRNSLGDSGCFADPRFGTFLLEATQSFFKLGALRLQWTEVDGEVVAFDSGFVDQEGVFVYQTGFDPNQSELSPGRLHFQASILKAIEEGYRFFDFLRGDEPYKAHFRATPVPVKEVRLISPRILPRLGHQFWKFQRQLKARVRPTVDASVCSAEEGAAVASEAAAATTSQAPGSQTPATDGSVGISVGRLAYRAAQRLCKLKVGHVLGVQLADLSRAKEPSGLEYRWLTADDVRALSVDSNNDLEASLAGRLDNGRNFCLGVFDGSQLASYCWFALGSIEPEHSLGCGLTFPADTVYLYKAFTRSDLRGRGLYPAAVRHAAGFFASRGLSRLIAIVEYGSRASLRSHEKLGCRRLGRIVNVGNGTWRFEPDSEPSETLGIRCGEGQ